MANLQEIAQCPHEEQTNATYQQVVDNIIELSTNGNALRFKAEQILFYEDHLPLGFYLLKSGEVSFSKERSTKGPVLGLHHLLANSPYCLTCTAKTDVEVTFISKVIVDKFLKGL